MSDVRTEVAKLAENARKLLAEVKRLRGDLRQITAVIDAIDMTYFPSFVSSTNDEEPEVPEPKKEWTVVQALNTIDTARRLIEGSEYDIRRVRSLFETIENNSYLRDDFKQFLKK